MSVRDFRILTPESYGSVLSAHTEARDARAEHDWHVARTLAAIVIQPHVRRRVTPCELIPLPSDKPARGAVPEGTSDLSRFAEITKRLQ